MAVEGSRGRAGLSPIHRGHPPRAGHVLSCVVTADLPGQPGPGCAGRTSPLHSSPYLVPKEISMQGFTPRLLRQGWSCGCRGAGTDLPTSAVRSREGVAGLRHPGKT